MGPSAPSFRITRVPLWLGSLTFQLDETAKVAKIR
jgi:hypothetical protein